MFCALYGSGYSTLVEIRAYHIDIMLRSGFRTPDRPVAFYTQSRTTSRLDYDSARQLSLIFDYKLTEC